MTASSASKNYNARKVALADRRCPNCGSWKEVVKWDGGTKVTLECGCKLQIKNPFNS